MKVCYRSLQAPPLDLSKPEYFAQATKTGDSDPYIAFRTRRPRLLNPGININRNQNGSKKSYRDQEEIKQGSIDKTLTCCTLQNFQRINTHKLVSSKKRGEGGRRQAC